MYLGLDLGTSGLKALLCDEGQRPLAAARAGYPMQVPGPGLCEQQPDDWIAAVGRAVAEVRSAVPAVSTDLKGIGLSGQMHGLVALDGTDRPLRPAILWNDVRGGGFVKRSGELIPHLAEITGVGAMTSFTAAKLDWLAFEEPETFEAIRRLVLPKDYLRLWLTGEWATDVSDAAGTQFLDQSARDWSAEVAKALRFDPAILPPLSEGSELAGTLRADVAAELGLPSVPVVTGGGDAATGALGAAVVDETRTLISLGTGAVVLVGARRYDPPANPSLHHFAHCVPDRWYRMAALLNCGSALDWMCEITGSGPSADALARLDARGWTRLSGATVVPYLDGVRTPHGNPNVRGAIVGLERSIDGLDLVQAMLEGICFTLADADAALRASGPVAEMPIVIGGGARSATLTRMLATILDRPLGVAVDAEGGSALGAVRLAMMGNGRTLDEVAKEPIPREITPDPALTDACRERFTAFRELYPALARYPG